MQPSASQRNTKRRASAGRGAAGDSASVSASVSSALSGASAPSDAQRARRARGGWSEGFAARREAALARSTRHNAAAASRTAAPMPAVDEDASVDSDDGAVEAGGATATARVRGAGAASVASRSSRVSRAPSLHPSLAGSTASTALSESTIGAGDDTGYWDFAHRTVEKGDLAHRCRECKRPFMKLGEPLTERACAARRLCAPAARRAADQRCLCCASPSVQVEARGSPCGCVPAGG